MNASKLPIRPLSITSYNVQMTPLHATNNRLIHIVKELKEKNSDVICLQECFLQCVVDVLMDFLKHFGYIYTAQDTQKRNFLKSGLLILSKYPLHQIKCHTYTSSSFIDSLSDKAFLSCLVKTPTHHIILINTHLQSDYPFLNYKNTRNRQTQQLIKSLFVKDELATDSLEQDIILCGDFNIDKKSKEYNHTLHYLRRKSITHGCSIHVYHTPNHAFTFGKNELLDHFFLISKKDSIYKTNRVNIANTFTNSDHKMITLE